MNKSRCVAPSRVVLEKGVREVRDTHTHTESEMVQQRVLRSHKAGGVPMHVLEYGDSVILTAVQSLQLRSLLEYLQ